MKSSYEFASQLYLVNLAPNGQGKSYRLTIGEQTVEVEVLQVEEGKLDLLVNGKPMTAYISSDAAKRWVTVNGQTFVLAKASGARRSGAGHHTAGELAAPMPGQVRAVNVSEGDMVSKGQTLLLLEAMKMEIRVQAPFDGKVSVVSVKVGQTVEREQTLVILDHG